MQWFRELYRFLKYKTKIKRKPQISIQFEKHLKRRLRGVFKENLDINTLQALVVIIVNGQ